jgi:hypothetical protein
MADMIGNFVAGHLSVSMQMPSYFTGERILRLRL